MKAPHGVLEKVDQISFVVSAPLHHAKLVTFPVVLGIGWRLIEVIKGYRHSDALKCPLCGLSPVTHTAWPPEE